MEIILKELEDEVITDSDVCAIIHDQVYKVVNNG